MQIHPYRFRFDSSFPFFFHFAFEVYWSWVFCRRRKAIDSNAPDSRFTMRRTLMLYLCLANKMSTYVCLLITRRSSRVSYSRSHFQSLTLCRSVCASNANEPSETNQIVILYQMIQNTYNNCQWWWWQRWQCIHPAVNRFCLCCWSRLLFHRFVPSHYRLCAYA